MFLERLDRIEKINGMDRLDHPVTRSKKKVHHKI
jgi:hypothetical protein